MVGWILKKILGSKNQREIKRLQPIVRTINEFDEQFKALSDDELRAKTAAWKAEVSRDRRSRGARPSARRDPARSVCGGEKRGPPPDGTPG